MRCCRRNGEKRGKCKSNIVEQSKNQFFSDDKQRMVKSCFACRGGDAKKRERLQIAEQIQSIVFVPFDKLSPRVRQMIREIRNSTL